MADLFVYPDTRWMLSAPFPEARLNRPVPQPMSCNLVAMEDMAGARESGSTRAAAARPNRLLSKVKGGHRKT